VLNYKLLIKLSRVTSSTAQTEESATKMAILVRGRWGIRHWTASPIGRLVTLPLWIPLAALRWDPTGHARLMFGLLVVEQHLDGLDELLGYGVEESVVGLSLLCLRGGHRAAPSGGDLVFGEVQRVMDRRDRSLESRNVGLT
jgi:hypothetical protein